MSITAQLQKPQSFLSRRVYFVPTQANCLLVEKLREFAPTNELEFIKLLLPSPIEQLRTGIRNDNFYLEVRKRREVFEDLILAVEKINIENATLIWGDGSMHHLSYYFDLREGIDRIMKVNIDGHEDFGMGKQIHCGNHMRFSHERKKYLGVTMLAQNKMITVVRGEPKVEKELMPRKEIFALRNMSHLTIDLDAITSFPAIAQWINDKGISIARVLRIIYDLKKATALTRLDLGGLVEDIPGFSVLSHPQTVDNPEFSVAEARKFAVDKGTETLPKNTIDQIMTFTVACYYKILKAAIFD
ncbi:MAG: hypothetical protein AABX38_01045 [Candidatus Micrarchaeota archaeon]